MGGAASAPRPDSGCGERSLRAPGSGARRRYRSVAPTVPLDRNVSPPPREPPAAAPAPPEGVGEQWRRRPAGLGGPGPGPLLEGGVGRCRWSRSLSLPRSGRASACYSAVAAERFLGSPPPAPALLFPLGGSRGGWAVRGG
ncbi:unnamed protein product [Lepidochelys olivacea]